MSKPDSMVCVHCGQRRQYPDGFPNQAYAECWPCAWNAHVHSKHPGDVRRIKRAAKKRARRLTQKEIAAVMTDHEHHQAFGFTKENR